MAVATSGSSEGGENRPIGNVFRVNLDGCRVAVGALHLLQQGSEEFLHAEIDVGAVKGGETGIDQSQKAADGPAFIGIFGPVSVRKLPESVDDATDRIPGREFEAFGHESSPVSPAPPVQRHPGDVAVAKGAATGADDPKPPSAVRIGAGDHGVGRHPVVGRRLPLFGREQGENRRQGDRAGSSVRPEARDSRRRARSSRPPCGCTPYRCRRRSLPLADPTG